MSEADANASNNVEQANALLLQAQQLIAENKIAQAQAVLQEAVEEDPNNIDAWVELARITEDDIDLRIALSNIEQIDPQHPYLTERKEQQAEAKTAKKARPAANLNDDWIPGVTQRELRFAIIGGALFVLISCSLTLLMTTGIQGARAAEEQRIAQLQRDTNNTVTARAEQATQTSDARTQSAVMATETAFASITPTQRPTRTPDLPPTFTPTFTPTVVSIEVYPPPPNQASGALYAWGGRDVLNTGFLELRQYRPNRRDTFTRLTDDQFVQYPTVDLAGEQVVYMRYFPNFDEWSLSRLSLEDAFPPQDLNLTLGELGVTETSQPYLSTDGTRLVFTATDVATGRTQIYLLNLVTAEAVPLTGDGANYSDPAIAPDNNRVVAVREDVETAPGPDLVLIDISALSGTPEDAPPEADDAGDNPFPQQMLTSDFETVIESAPYWRPDGNDFVYAGLRENQPDKADIYVMQFAGESGLPNLLFETEADKRFPVYSPSGRYVAFASNPVNQWDLFLYELPTASFYQITATETDEFPHGWSR